MRPACEQIFLRHSQKNIVLLKNFTSHKIQVKFRKMCVTLRLITIKLEIVTQNHRTSSLRNAIKVSFGWNFRIPLTPDQLPSSGHGGGSGSHSPAEKISVL